MRTKTKVVLMLVFMALCVVTLSCRKDSTTTTEPDTPVTPITPTNDCDDPENTIVVNLRNDGGTVTMLGCQLRINNANNFVSDDPHVTFVNVGQVSGLGCVEDIPEAGWSDQVAVTSRNGYVVKSHRLDETTGLPVDNYARIFVVKYLLADNNGGIVGAVLKYQDNWEQNEPPTPPTPTPPGEIQSMPYTQSFETEFGTYSTADVLGPQSWKIDYSTAWMSGYANGVHYANEDWLISSPVAVTGVAHAKVVVNYMAMYTNNNSEDVTLQVSTDYVIGNAPNTATWMQMPAAYSNSSNWSDVRTVETSLDDFIGQNIIVAIKYTSSEEHSRTIEVKSITVEEGEAGGVTPTPPTPGPGGGSGTADDPYNVASGIALQGQEIVGWVQGYIVGAARNGLPTVSSNDDIIWSAPFDSYTHVLIADDPTCHEVSQCLFVNLPAGKPLRSQVNLFDNPDNLGKMLAVNGKLRTYFGQAGLRDSGGTENDFVLEGGAPTPPPTPGYIFSETFANGQGGFTIQDVLMPSELTYIWTHLSSYSCMKASAYVGQAYDAESWLVSPSIYIPVEATLSFDQALNYASPDGVSVMISSNYYGDVTTATWTELNLSVWPAGNNWIFINSTADLSPYAGQTVNIAFKYTSTTSASASWEVKNCLIFAAQ